MIYLHPHGRIRPIQCSRWEELVDSLKFLAEMCNSLGVATQFQLLNGADPIIIGLKSDDDSLDVSLLRIP